MSEFPKNLLTRRGGIAYLKEKGVPATISTLEKMSMHGFGPKPDLYYGRVELFFPETMEQWARERLLSRESRTLGVNGRKDRDAA